MSTWPNVAMVLSTTACTSAGFDDVAEHAFDAEAARAHLVDGRRQPLVAPRAQHQRRAGFGEAFRHLLAEAARSAGDDRDAAVQLEQFVDGWHVVRLILLAAPGVNVPMRES